MPCCAITHLLSGRPSLLLVKSLNPRFVQLHNRLQIVLVRADVRAVLADSPQPPRLNGALPLYVARGARS